MASHQSTYVRVAPSPRFKDSQTPASSELIQMRVQHMLPQTTQRAKERVGNLKRLYAVPHALLLREHATAMAETLHRLRLVKAVRNIKVLGAGGSSNAVAGALCLPFHSCAALPAVPAVVSGDSGSSSTSSARVLTGSADGLLTLWDAKHCTPLRSQSTYADSHGWGRVKSIVVHPRQQGGASAASATSFAFTASMFQRPLTTASTTSAETVDSSSGGGVGGLQQLALDPTGALLAATHATGIVHVWDARAVLEGTSSSAAASPVADTSPLTHLYAQDGYETAGATLGIAFHPDGSLLTTSDAGGRIVAWDTRSGQLAFHTGGRVGGHLRAALCVAWSPCGVRVASGGGDGVVHLYDARKLSKAGLGPHNDAGGGAAPFQLLGHDDAVTSLSFYANPLSSGGRGALSQVLPIGLVTTSLDHTVRIWDADTGLCVRTLDAGMPLYAQCRPQLPPVSSRFASSTAIMVVGHSKNWLLYDVDTADEVVVAGGSGITVTENDIVVSAHGSAEDMRFSVLTSYASRLTNDNEETDSGSSDDDDEMMALRKKPLPSQGLVLSSLCFLQRMASVFEQQGNYAECVKSVESALLLRQANTAAVGNALAERRRALKNRASQHRPAKMRRGAPSTGDIDDDYVPLTDDGDVALPMNICLQAQEAVLRCNSYAVEALQHAQYDSAAFFLNRAMFLTDGDEDAQQEASTTDGAVGGITSSSGGTVSGQWWWRAVLQSSAPQPESQPAVAIVDSIDLDELTNTQDEVKHDTAATAAAFRACFGPTPHDQQLRLSLRVVTLNHLGCLEQRRGRPRAAVVFLRMAIQTQAQLDESRRVDGDAVVQALPKARRCHLSSNSSGTEGTASTYLNLCTVLNELGQHAEAAQVCERVIPLLQQALLECSSAHTAATAEDEADLRTQQQARTATMLAVALYSFGASLERRDAASANVNAQRWAFQEAIQVCHRYGLVPACCRTIEQVMQALRHPGAATVPAEKGSCTAAPSAAAGMHGGEVRWAEEGSRSALPFTGSSAAKALASAKGRSGVDVAASRPLPPSMNPSSWEASSAVTPMADVLQFGAPTEHEAPLHCPPLQPVQTGPKRLSLPPTSSTAVHTASLPAPQQPPAPSAFLRPSGHGSPLPPQLPPLAASYPGGQQNAWRAPPEAPAPRSPPSVLEPLTISDIKVAATAPPTLALRPSMVAPSTSAFPLTQWRGLPLAVASGSASTTSMTSGPANPRTSIAASVPAALPRSSLRTSIAGLTTGAANVAARFTPNPPRGGRLQAAVSDRQRTLKNAKRQQSKFQKSLERRQQLETAVADAALAEKVFQQLISEKSKTEVERCRRAAAQIQRIWRGVLARTWVATLIAAALRLQRVVRRFLVRVRVQHAREAEERARQQAEELARQEVACRVLQARARQFLRRLQIRRTYRANQARHYYAARTIQRGYRAFCERRAAFLAARAEANRRKDEQWQFRQKVAARRIQSSYLEYRMKRAELDEHRARQRRVRATVHIQAVVRGYLTRAWYAYYRVYRRDQEVRSAAMQSKLVMIQSACRAICSAYYGQQRALHAFFAMREARQHRAATRLQSLWRCYVAKIRRARLQAEHDCLVRHAVRIQRWYRMRVLRRAFLVYKAEQQRIRAASRVQRWLRECWQAVKAREFAAYHAELLRQQQQKRLQARAIGVLQACCTACLSDRLVASVRRMYQRHDTVVRVWQRVGRGFAARREMALERRVAYWVAVKERETARRMAAVCVLQQAWRCAAAKDKVQRMRREVAAADVITRAYRVYRARVQLADLRRARQLHLEDAAARRIQRAFADFLHLQRAKETEAYYRGEHRKKMHRLRRQEAAIMIQSVWRGHVTRKAVERDREELQAFSAAAVRIQRAWHSRRSRRQLSRELSQRIKERARDAEAALVVQCFWRKIMAGRRAAHQRVVTQQRLVAAVHVQMWWRVQLAQREFARRRILRREEAALELYYAMQWEAHVSLVNSFVRARQAQVLSRDRLRDCLVGQLTEAERHRFANRHAAATKIQALYRGHYERVYVRGLVAQAREEARRTAVLAARQQRAALAIQCAYRCARSRQQLADLKQAELERVLVSHQEFAEKADPAEVVRELFWLNTTYQQREACNARRREAEQKRAAAASIQRAYRCYKSRQQVSTAADLHQRERAARLLQDCWRHHRDVHRIKKRQRRQAAATRLQCHIRGWLVRRSWPLWRAAVEAERQEHVLLQDMLDQTFREHQCRRMERTLRGRL
ncbi:WD domain, G-beta repeat family protein [Leishmania donovani]|uniref:WD domain, G-beta repeat family protein n=1 Tax=Leishmania donovani TaxID=5661 RepID=A0A504Y8S8_LEIDO|nr:WD domain, G-beta repeat family protein [Leishmania donovani]